MSPLTVRLIRHAAWPATIAFRPSRRLTIQRWLRGWEEHERLRRADAVVVSFGKSGRTWLRVMLSRFYQLRYDLSQRSLMSFANLHRRNPEIPRILFTHDNYLKDWTGDAPSKVAYRGHRIVLLVRHPADVAVSQFFQWKYRMRPHKMRLNAYPPPDPDLPLFDFVMGDSGLLKVIAFMNQWAEAMPLPDLLLIRYEDLRADPEEGLERLLVFLGTPGTGEQVTGAVEWSSVENMRNLESQKTFWLSGRRMLPGDRKNPQSFKVRRAKVGGWRDDFTTDQIGSIERLVEATLDPVYRYGGAEVLPITGA